MNKKFYSFLFLGFISLIVRCMDVADIREAVLNGKVERVKELVELNSTLVNVQNEFKWSLLHTAAFWGNTEIARLLLQHGAHTDIEDVNYKTPLHVAACCGHEEFVLLLLYNGANINVQNDCGMTPLDNAQKNNHPAVAQLLKDWSKCKNCTTQQMISAHSQNNTIEQIHFLAEQQRREERRRVVKSIARNLLCYGSVAIPVAASIVYIIYRVSKK